jgi:hypothetical protein
LVDHKVVSRRILPTGQDDRHPFGATVQVGIGYGNRVGARRERTERIIAVRIGGRVGNHGARRIGQRHGVPHRRPSAVSQHGIRHVAGNDGGAGLLALPGARTGTCGALTGTCGARTGTSTVAARRRGRVEGKGEFGNGEVETDAAKFEGERLFRHFDRLGIETRAGNIRHVRKQIVIAGGKAKTIEVRREGRNGRRGPIFQRFAGQPARSHRSWRGGAAKRISQIGQEVEHGKDPLVGVRGVGVLQSGGTNDRFQMHLMCQSHRSGHEDWTNTERDGTDAKHSHDGINRSCFKCQICCYVRWRRGPS